MSGRRRALVIGAGLAGCSTALALARQGWEVRMVALPPGNDASDVPAAILAPPPLRGNDHVTAFRYRAARIARGWYQHLASRHPAACLGHGVLLMPKRERDRHRFDRLRLDGNGPVRVSAERASTLSGASIRQPCAYHPGGGWFDPGALCTGMQDANGLHAPIQAACRELRRCGSEWLALDPGGEQIAAAPVCIVAAGMGTTSLLPRTGSLLVPARGQVTAVRNGRLAMAVSGDGYAVPGKDGTLWLGATIGRGDDDRSRRPEDDHRNLALHGRLWPDEPTPEPCASFTAVRATTRDRLPLAGMIEDGLWINAGHGTQGLLTTPVTALVLARAIAHHRVHPLLASLDPNRPNARPRAPLP